MKALCRITLIGGLLAGPLFGAELILPDPAYRVGWIPNNLAVADFNEDGHLDIVNSSENQATFDILLGDGNGSFEHSSVSDPPLTDWVGVDDFNGDGHADVATLDEGEIGISLHLGRGDGTFEAPLETPWGIPQLSSIWHYHQIADFDEDGKPDIALSTPLDGTHVLRGNGDGTFTSMQLINTDAVIATGDLDEDNHIDLLMAGGCIHYGDGDGGFAVNPSRECLPGGGSYEIRSLVDLDDDGDLDYAWQREDQVWVALNDGSGQADVAVGYPGADTLWGPVFVADLNDDGKDDILANGLRDDASISYSRGDGTLDPAVPLEVPMYTLAFAFADFDEDGQVDLAMIDGNHYVAVVRRTEDGGFRPRQRTVIPIDGNTRGPVQGDVNLDGHPDIALTNFTRDRLEVHYGDGKGTFDPSPTLVPVPEAALPRDLLLTDIDSDQDLDLLALNTEGPDLMVALGDGTEAMGEPVFTSLPIGSVQMASGHFDGNAQLDMIVLRSAAEQWWADVWVGQGNGGFVPGEQYLGPLSGHWTASPFEDWGAGRMATADLNGDGSTDVAFLHEDPDQISVRLSDGQAGFGQPSYLLLSGDPTILKLEDINQDGAVDVVASRSRGSEIQVRLGLGDGTFGPLYSTPGSALGVVTDLDGDGRTDLIRHDVRWWPGRGDGTFDVTPVEFASEGFGIAAADFDGDTRVDVVTVGLNRLEVHLNRGPFVFGFEVDKVHLAWPIVEGALTYNVYRGLLSQLVDVDNDGLPDTGYGSCLTGQDDAPSDNSIEDALVPPVGDGFFYLRSTVFEDGEASLGATSEGLPRSVTTPCP